MRTQVGNFANLFADPNTRDIHTTHARPQQQRLIRFIALWMRVFLRAALLTGPVVVCLAAFFAPALYMNKQDLAEIRTLLYDQIGSLLELFLVYGFAVVYAILLFGIRLSWRGIAFIILPANFASIILRLMLDQLHASYVFSILAMVAFLESIKRNKSVVESPFAFIHVLESRQLVASKLKAMVWLIGIAITTFSSLLPLYLNSEIYGKIALRFVFLPVVASVCSGLQLRVLKTLPLELSDYAVPLIGISNGILKLSERLFTNNIFASDDYLSFSVLMLCATAVEFVNHATYFQRAAFVNQMFNQWSHFLHRTRIQPNQTITTIQTRVVSNETNTNPEQNVGEQTHSQELTANEQFKWAQDIRRRLIAEDIVVELQMIIAVTSLLYFIHPVVDASGFGEIPSVENYLIQLVIQLVFEASSDIFGLYWTETKDHVDLNPAHFFFYDRWYALWFVFMLWETFNLLGWIINYST
eukprot:TRINITY_DN6489_c0_g2_i1.p1 TRINITY_DN6489_c0_g2~~TRINITY_DN6489_c0_g2_i1.p1  ORF type:complete len:471 (-),score=97.18 TRINITY_DN6489_c0_g2_i1:1627-3039(-)